MRDASGWTLDEYMFHGGHPGAAPLIREPVRAPQAHRGTGAFTQSFKVHRTLLVGGDGVSVEDFLLEPVSHWLGPCIAEAVGAPIEATPQLGDVVTRICP